MTGVSTWSNLRSEIEFLKQYPILSQATADNQVPISGHLLHEINNLTQIGNGCHCKQLVDYIMSRAQCDSPVVKIKILKLLLHLVKNGHSSIPDILKSNEMMIRELTGANGPPDALHGKAHYGNIRQLAKELLHVIYSEENLSSFASSSKSVENAPDGSKMGGYGSIASFNKLQGFGNTVQTTRTVGERVTEGFTNIVDRMLSSNVVQEKERQSMLLAETLPHYEPLKIHKPIDERLSTDSVSFTDLNESKLNQRVASLLPSKEVFRLEKPGGGWDDDNEDSFENIHSDVQDMHNNLSNCNAVSVDSLCSKPDVVSSQDFLDEHKVVDDFTINQPINELNWDELISTCKRCTTLNCDKIVDFLICKLDNDAENTKLRALICLEVLLYKDIVSVESLIKNALHKLQSQCHLKPCAVQLKAKKICLIIEKLNCAQIPNFVKE